MVEIRMRCLLNSSGVKCVNSKLNERAQAVVLSFGISESTHFIRLQRAKFARLNKKNKFDCDDGVHNSRIDQDKCRLF